MRILILAHARSGSTTLLNWLGYELGYKTIDEPFNHKHPYSGDNVVVKELINHLFDKDVTEFINEFDKIIGLVRTDTFQCAISLLHSIQNGKEHNVYSINEEWLELHNDELISLSENIKSVNLQIQSIPNILQVSYEDIFDKGDIKSICDYLEINNLKYLGMLNKSLKLRNKVKTII